MKPRIKQCPLVPAGAKEICPLKPAALRQRSGGQGGMVVVRTEKRSWFTVAITGFGALMLRYLKTVRERAHTVRTK